MSSEFVCSNGMSLAFVCSMGMGIVFAGLICLVIICNIMGVLVRKLEKTGRQNTEAPAPAPVSAAAQQPAAAMPQSEKRAVIAGVCSIIAEELGTDVSSIRVLSFKKV